MADMIEHVHCEVYDWYTELARTLVKRTSMQIIMLPSWPSKTAERVLVKLLLDYPEFNEVRKEIENELSLTAYENRYGDPEILETED